MEEIVLSRIILLIIILGLGMNLSPTPQYTYAHVTTDDHSAAFHRSSASSS